MPISRTLIPSHELPTSPLWLLQVILKTLVDTGYRHSHAHGPDQANQEKTPGPPEEALALFLCPSPKAWHPLYPSHFAQ